MSASPQHGIQLSNDLFLAPDVPRLSSGSKPGYYETSEYLIGKVAVGVILLESNGYIDPSTEDWTSARESQVVNEIRSGLSWLANYNPNAHVSFVYNIHYKVPTSYEPINRPHTDEKLWISEAMTNLGYPGANYFSQVRDYTNALRSNLDTEWSFAIFVIDSLNDPDGCFTDWIDPTRKWSSFAYLGGPYLIMTYDNNSYGIENMDFVAAHETSHVFYATDEYNNVREYSGYLNVVDKEGSGDMMDKALSWWLCTNSREQLGWRDSDGDGIQDIVDTFPKTTLTLVPSSLTDATTVTYKGSIEEIPYSNRNPFGTGRDVTINTIKTVRFRADGGLWLSAVSADGSFDDVYEEFTFVISSLPIGLHNVEVYSVNSVNNFETPSVKHMFSVTFIIIDRSSVSGTRVDVGSIQEISFHAIWAHDLSPLRGSVVYVNGIAYLTGPDGWVNVSISSHQAGKQLWSVTGVKVGDITKYTQVAPRPEVIFDRIQVTISTPQERVEVGTKAPLTWTGKYEYDGATFTGEVTLSEELMKSSIGRFNYTVKNIHDPLYGLKTFVSNTVDVIFDKIVIDLQAETLIPGSIKPIVRLRYQFDGTPVVDAKVVIDGTEATNLGDGSYITSISTWSPYVTYNIQIDRSGFITMRTSGSIFAIGNIIIISSIIIVLAVVIITAVKRRRGLIRKD